MAVASKPLTYRSPTVDTVRTAGVVGADGITCVRVGQLLEAASYDVVFQAPDHAAATDGQPAVDVVVMVDTGQRHGVAEDVRALRKSLSEDALIAVVSADSRHGAVQSALAAGALAFVALERLDEALVPSLAAALAGQVALPATRERQLMSQVLTSREKQVLALVVMGLTNAEIAGKLFLAESTVKSHLSSAFSKLGVRSRNEAAATILDPNSGVGTGILMIEGHGTWSSP
jgi:DNA-binding NarL/FixJ family response regulator